MKIFTSSSDIKRLFFGFAVHAPWPEILPSGRLLHQEDLHTTIAFLGNVSYEKVTALLSEIPKPPFTLGLAGYFDRCLFLPESTPRCVSWHQRWWESTPIKQYHYSLIAWLEQRHFSMRKESEFLAHVTLCRQPFHRGEWKRSFTPLPFYIGDLHLYESLGSLSYKPLWSYPLRPPFEEIEHTADIAFLVRGTTIHQIYEHAQTAISFRYPQLTPYFSCRKTVENLDDLIIELNKQITTADRKSGCCPIKAVSFHGELCKHEDALTWEMIVDV